MVTSCFVWIVYGMVQGQPQLWWTNSIELLLSVYYFVEFTNYAPKAARTLPGSVHAHLQFCTGVGSMTLLGLGVVAWVTAGDAAAWETTTSTLLGNLTVVLTIVTFASPLVATKVVLATQSSDSIPWPFTLAAFVNCILWIIVGVIELRDYYVALPAMVGVVLCTIQIALKVWYRKDTTTTNTNTANTSFSSSSLQHRDMPYPLLGTLRQVMMLGNIPEDNPNTDNHNFHNYQPPSSSPSALYHHPSSYSDIIEDEEKRPLEWWTWWQS